MKASLKNYRQSPRKVRLVVDTVRGKTVEEAFNILNFLPKKASLAVSKLIKSAYANLLNSGASVDSNQVIVKKITVDEGVVMRRFIPKWRGTAHPILKRNSHVSVELAHKVVNKK